MSGTYVNPWTDERIAQLTELWAAGKSAGLIAREMQVTRNTVMGKVKRLGLDARETLEGLVVRQFAPGRPGPRRYPKQRINWVPQEKEPDPPFDQFANAVTLHELNSRNCHWPLWHADEAIKLYCGSVAVEGESYCPWHCRIAYSKPSTREERAAQVRRFKKVRATLLKVA